MNAWVFRHLDELQRIYAEPTPDLPTVAPAEAREARPRGGQAPPKGPPPNGPAPTGSEAPGASPSEAAPTPPPGAAGDGDPFAGGEDAADAPGGPLPGAVIRHETPEGPDIVLIPRVATAGPGGRGRRPRRAR